MLAEHSVRGPRRHQEGALDMFDSTSARWIWPSHLGDGQNQYVQFRHDFTLSEPDPCADIRISCDSNYALWVNGRFVDFGQYHDYPDSKTYDSIPIGHLLRAGANVVCVLLHYQGEHSFQYIKGDPGLVYAIHSGSETIGSGCSTRYRACRGYRQGEIARVTPQLGFTFDYDARADSPDWLAPDFAMGDEWTAISESDTTPLASRPVSGPRPISKPVLRESIPSRIVDQGCFRTASDSATSPVAEVMQTAILSGLPVREFLGEPDTPTLPSLGGIRLPARLPADSDGLYIIVDLGREEAGLLELDLEAGEGTVVDVAWGEHLEDGRVRAHVGGRCFAGRYVCRSGRQRFTHYFLRLAGRYLQLHFHGATEDIALHYAGLLPVEYPVSRLGSFTSSDASLNSIHETSVRTLHLCMHEHYEDCPWREQALYAMDMRNQALCGYYCFGDYAFAAASLDLLGKGLGSDGYLEMCAPAKIAITIPSFSMAWVVALADHLMYSGDTAFAAEQLTRVSKMMDCHRGSLVEGLLPCPTGPRYWQFYEWADGLYGVDREGDSCFSVIERLRIDAPLNLFYCLALDAAATLARWCGVADLADRYSSEARCLREAIHGLFWDGRSGLYRTRSDDEPKRHFAELTQSLALVAGVCPADAAAGLRERLAAGGPNVVRTTLSHSLYKYEALLQDPDRYGSFVFDDIRRDWGHMLDSGATSFWETIKGAADFDDAGSLCHGWSGIPVYFLQAYVLGIKPAEPGFARYSFRPLAGVAASASGRVPTPSGPIEVETDEDGAEPGRRVTSPDGVSRCSK